MSTITTTYLTPVPAPAALRVAERGSVGAWRCLIVRARAFTIRMELLLLALGTTALWAAVRTGVVTAGPETASAFVVLAACRASFYIARVQRFITAKALPFAAGLARSTVLALGFCAALFALVPTLAPDAAAVAAVALYSLSASVLLRQSTCALIRRRTLVDTCLIVGGSEKAKRFLNEIVSTHGPGVLTVGDGSDGGLLVEQEHVQDLVARGELTRIVVADAPLAHHPELQALLLDSRLRGLVIEDALDAYERLSGKIWVEGLRPEWLIYSAGFRPSSSFLSVKRAFDVVAAIALLLLAGPLMLLIAAAIKLESPGPALFAQERVGQHGWTFTLYKFRSMRQDAETHSGPVWAGEHDDRITPLGRILRKCRLDELPQIWNVLRGEMSFVGPRPERPYFVDLLKENIPFYDLRHYIQPGITGWAQVSYPYGASIDDAYQKLQYDLYYGKHMSILFDLVVLVKTFYVVIAGRGAR